MLADRVKEWTEQWKREGLEAGRREGLQQGLQQGLRQGRADLLLRILEKRFGKVPEGLRGRVEGADLETLATWVERAFEAKSLEDVFAG